jgi:hypothetical protein
MCGRIRRACRFTSTTVQILTQNTLVMRPSATIVRGLQLENSGGWSHTASSVLVATRFTRFTSTRVTSTSTDAEGGGSWSHATRSVVVGAALAPLLALLSSLPPLSAGAQFTRFTSTKAQIQKRKY